MTDTIIAMCLIAFTALMVGYIWGYDNGFNKGARI